MAFIHVYVEKPLSSCRNSSFSPEVYGGRNSGSSIPGSQRPSTSYQFPIKQNYQTPCKNLETKTNLTGPTRVVSEWKNAPQPVLPKQKSSRNAFAGNQNNNSNNRSSAFSNNNLVQDGPDQGSSNVELIDSYASNPSSSLGAKLLEQNDDGLNDDSDSINLLATAFDFDGSSRDFPVPPPRRNRSTNTSSEPTAVFRRESHKKKGKRRQRLNTESSTEASSAVAENSPFAISDPSVSASINNHHDETEAAPLFDPINEEFPEFAGMDPQPVIPNNGRLGDPIEGADGGPSSTNPSKRRRLPADPDVPLRRSARTPKQNRKFEADGSEPDLWRCPDCTAHFLRRIHLQEHQEIEHIDLEKFQCDYCIAGFRFRAEKRMHVYEMHDDKLATCKHCQQIFTSTQSRDSHERVSHPPSSSTSTAAQSSSASTSSSNNNHQKAAQSSKTIASSHHPQHSSSTTAGNAKNSSTTTKTAKEEKSFRLRPKKIIPFSRHLLPSEILRPQQQQEQQQQAPLTTTGNNSKNNNNSQQLIRTSAVVEELSNLPLKTNQSNHHHDVDTDDQSENYSDCDQSENGEVYCFDNDDDDDDENEQEGDEEVSSDQSSFGDEEEENDNDNQQVTIAPSKPPKDDDNDDDDTVNLMLDENVVIIRKS